jgi:hypothetical protein
VKFMNSLAQISESEIAEVRKLDYFAASARGDEREYFYEPDAAGGVQPFQGCG